MNFLDALEALKSGANIVRSGWTEAEGYLALMDGMLHAWKILPHPNPNAGNHIFSIEELSANDWQVKQRGVSVVAEAPAAEAVA